MKEIVIYTIFLRSVIFPYNSLYTQAVAYTTYFELGAPVLEQAKLRQILENNSKGVLFRKWLDRWYVVLTFSICNILNLGDSDQFFLYKMHQFPQYPPGLIYPGLPSGNTFNDRGNPSSSPSTTNSDSLPESLPFSKDSSMPVSTQQNFFALYIRYMCLSAENRKTQDRWSKEEEKLLNRTWRSQHAVMFCSDFFSSATVGFRTNFLSLADFKSDLSRTNLKLSSSATWP